MAAYAQDTNNDEFTNEDEDLTGDRTKTTLDSLFADLKKQTKSGAAKRISRRISREWSDSGSDSINLLMDRAGTAMKDQRNGLALDILDQIVTLAPDYSEGWNRRGTVYFTIKDYSRSLADIERVLALESRHYGALSGLALILTRLGRTEKALETWYRVLQIYPANESAQKQVIELEEKRSGERT